MDAVERGREGTLSGENAFCISIAESATAAGNRVALRALGFAVEGIEVLFSTSVAEMAGGVLERFWAATSGRDREINARLCVVFKGGFSEAFSCSDEKREGSDESIICLKDPASKSGGGAFKENLGVVGLDLSSNSEGDTMYAENLFKSATAFVL
jgi:hypothetical protein